MAYRAQEVDERAVEVGRRQSLAREVNERIGELSETLDLGEGMTILCECGRPDCNERILLGEAQYEQLRRIPTHFAVLRGHDIPEVERIVEQHTAFVVVEKFGEGAITAIKLDPRRRTR